MRDAKKSEAGNVEGGIFGGSPRYVMVGLWHFYADAE